MRALFKTIRFAVATLRVRSLEIELANLRQSVAYVRDPATLSAAAFRREKISAELARARAAWRGFHAPGTRFTWADA